MKKQLAEETVGNIVTRNFRTADVFYRLGIDFCCGGKKRLDLTCADKGVDLNLALSQLEEVLGQGSGDSVDYNSWPLDLLTDYIVKVHHAYVYQNAPILRQYLVKINSVHGSRHPELGEVLELFTDSMEDLLQHMHKEEKMLFSWIKQLSGDTLSGETPPRIMGSLQAPIQMMMTEHETEGERFSRMRALTDDFTPPTDACTTYRVAFEKLVDFEKDLHKHIHLENNILFPRALKLEPMEESAGNSCMIR